MDFEQRMDEIKKKIVSSLSESGYLPDSICVYHLSFDRQTLEHWHAEVEAYKDAEDGPYFFIFEKTARGVYRWINEAKSRKNSDWHLGAEIPQKEE